MKFLSPALFILIALLGAGLLLSAAYSWRAEQLIAVGELGDAPFISGFNSDEAGAPRYRWTGSSRPLDKASATITFPVKPNPAKTTLKLELGAANGKAFTVTIFANGLEIGQAATVAGQMREFEFTVPPKAIDLADQFQVQIDSPVFTPGNGDPRSLGVKVQAVRLLSSPTFRLPPPDLWLCASAYVLLVSLFVYRGYVLSTTPLRVQATQRHKDTKVFKIFSALVSSSLRATYVGLVFALALLLPWLALPYLAPRNLNLWYGPYLLPFATVLAAIIALFVWQGALATALEGLPNFRQEAYLTADNARWAPLEKGNLARNILLVFIIAYLIFSFSVIARMDYIGHADYADNGVVARNLVQGRGLSADYAAQFYVKYPQLPRPADTWPLLQPLMISPFFLLFGPTALAAKLPNWLLMAALAWAVFYFGARLFNKRVGLGAALLCLTSPTFFETVTYPINDLSFTLFTFLTLGTLYLAATGAAALKPAFQPSALFFEPVFRPWLLAGVWSGLLFWSKPSGATILVAAGLWLLLQKFSNKALFIPWRGLFTWGIVTILVISPLIVRNLLQFHSPFYSTEQYDAWLKYNPPEERIYDLYYPNPGRALPAPNQILLSGFDIFFRINSLQFQKEWNDLTGGGYIMPLLLCLALLGLVGFPRRRASLGGLISFAFLVYVLFINLYWHYEIRYFMAWLPWFYVFGLFGLTWLLDKVFLFTTKPPQPADFDNLEKSEPAARLPPSWRPQPIQSFLAMAALLVVFLFIWLPDVSTLLDETRINGYTGRTGIVMAADWFRQNTPAQARVMSRNIWEFSFHSDRQGATIPSNASLAEIKQVMKDYNIRYLQLDHTNLDANDNPDWEPWKLRRAIWPLIRKELDQSGQYNGFKKVYDDKFGFIIYELVEK